VSIPSIRDDLPPFLLSILLLTTTAVVHFDGTYLILVTSLELAASSVKNKLPRHPQAERRSGRKHVPR
jgi:hypothetical protein